MLYQGVVQPVITRETPGHKSVALLLVQTALQVSLGLHLDFRNRFILHNSKTGILTLYKFSIFLLLEVLLYLRDSCRCHIQISKFFVSLLID